MSAHCRTIILSINVSEFKFKFSCKFNPIQD